MASIWPEVSLCRSENRRELNLQGPEITKRIEDHGFDKDIFDLSSLNFLSISKTCLPDISDSLSRLGNLTSLVLHNNKLKALPPVFDDLNKLKLLDVSFNELVCVPDDLCQVSSLETLNLSSNNMESFPGVANLKSLHFLNLSSNRLSSLPQGLCDSSLVHLSTVNASCNCIGYIPTELSDLPHLNTLDLSQNKITEVPPELSECAKLKDLSLQGNKLKDRRLGKLIDQCGTKSVVEYLATQLKKIRKESGKKDGKNKKKKGKNQETEEISKNIIRVIHFQDSQGLSIQVKPPVLSVRQYIVCCIVRSLNMQEPSDSFKRFITLQTKLHDTTCQKRQLATVATHDLKKIKQPLEYTAVFPHDLKIIPLGRNKETSAEVLVDNLKREAEEVRKEKKRNTISGIHKYLELLEGRVQYPCFYNGDKTAISFPPITNSDQTKISKETTDILIEVTSCTNLEICKTVLDELLFRMLEMGIGSDPSTLSADGKGEDEEGAKAEEATPALHKLVVEQVKIVDNEENLRVLYPSRTDLNLSAYKVIRDYD